MVVFLYGYILYVYIIWLLIIFWHITNFILIYNFFIYTYNFILKWLHSDIIIIKHANPHKKNSSTMVSLFNYILKFDRLHHKSISENLLSNMVTQILTNIFDKFLDVLNSWVHSQINGLVGSLIDLWDIVIGSYRLLLSVRN